LRYIDGKPPEPGRHIGKIVERTKIIEKQTDLDINAIANAVVQAINRKIDGKIEVKNEFKDDFNDEETMKKIADVMTTSKKSESNFENLGNVEKTKSENSDKTIDLLSKLD